MTPATRPVLSMVLSIWIGTIVTLTATLGLTAPGALRAHRDSYIAQTTLRNTARDAGIITALRAAVPESPADDQARGGLTPRVTSALERAGLPASALASLSPEAKTQLAGQPGLRVSRRRATLTLTGVTLPQVGKFLDAWRSAEPAWTAASIDISPAGGKAPEAGGDLPLRVVITIEATLVRRDGEQR